MARKALDTLHHAVAKLAFLADAVAFREADHPVPEQALDGAAILLRELQADMRGALNELEQAEKRPTSRTRPTTEQIAREIGAAMPAN